MNYVRSSTVIGLLRLEALTKRAAPPVPGLAVRPSGASLFNPVGALEKYLPQASAVRPTVSPSLLIDTAKPFAKVAPSVPQASSVVPHVPVAPLVRGIGSTLPESPSLLTPTIPPPVTLRSLTGQYASDMVGRQPGGPLAGTRMFDSTTVKPYLNVSEYAKRRAGATDWAAEQKTLADKFQLPGAISRNVPVLGKVTDLTNRAVNAIDRTPLLHPLMFAGRTAKTFLETPFTHPLLNRKMPRLNALIGGGQKALTYGTGAAGLASLPEATRRHATDDYRRVLDAAGVSDKQGDRAQQKFYDNFNSGLRKNILPVEIGGEDSPLADAHRQFLRETAKQRMSGAAYSSYRSVGEPVTGAVRSVVEPLNLNPTGSDVADVLSYTRGMTPGGQIANYLMRNVAKPLDTEDVDRTALRIGREKGPSIVNDLLENKRPRGLAEFYQSTLPSNPFGNHTDNTRVLGTISPDLNTKMYDEAWRLRNATTAYIPNYVRREVAPNTVSGGADQLLYGAMDAPTVVGNDLANLAVPGYPFATGVKYEASNPEGRLGALSDAIKKDRERLNRRR